MDHDDEHAVSRRLRPRTVTYIIAPSTYDGLDVTAAAFIITWFLTTPAT